VTAAAPRPDDTESTTVTREYALSANDVEEADGEWVTEDEELDREERLRQQLLKQAIENPEALEKALETASDSMREIIEWALEVASEGYEEAIDNLR
jgi:fructose-specific phosphotransferase system component IIB